MPAKITVQSGIAAGASHWIQQRVVRIGSDPSAEVCLPSANVPGHALTLEFKDGNYRIYNRCRDNVFVGTRVVEPNRVATWLDTDILQLDDVELVIDIDDDPTPRPVRNSVMAAYHSAGKDTPSDSTSPTRASAPRTKDDKPASGSQSNTLLQLAVIVVCVLGSGLLLMRNPAKKSDELGSQRGSFADVVRQAIESTDTAPQLIQRLQYAEQARVRGDSSEARTRFANLRHDLVPQRHGFEDDQRKPELAILRFVDGRLAELAD